MPVFQTGYAGSIPVVRSMPQRTACDSPFVRGTARFDPGLRLDTGTILTTTPQVVRGARYMRRKHCGDAADS